jgi:hypothetical protein
MAVGLQSTIPKFNSFQKGQVLPPDAVFEANGDVYNIATSQGAKLQEIFLQNNSAVAVKVCLNNEASAELFHFVLKAATGADAGDGGERSIDMSLAVSRVSIFSAGGAHRVSVTKVVNLNGAQGRY